jgi:hypothetical protein
MQITSRQQNIIDIITVLQQAPISKIKEQLHAHVSMPTLNREMAAFFLRFEKISSSVQ